jgi:hypothetical protein
VKTRFQNVPFKFYLRRSVMGGQAVAGVVSAVVAMVSTLSLGGGGGDVDEGRGSSQNRSSDSGSDSYSSSGITGGSWGAAQSVGTMDGSSSSHALLSSSSSSGGQVGVGVGDEASSRAAAAQDEASLQAAAYFFTAAALVFACFVGCLFLERVPFYRHRVAAAEVARRVEVERESRRKRRRRQKRRRQRHRRRVAGAGLETEGDETAAVPLLDATEEEREGDDESGDDASYDDGDVDGSDDSLGLDDDDEEVGGGDRTLSASASSEVACYRLSVFVTFALTLSMFPAVTSSICSARNPAVTPPCAPNPAGGRFFGDLWVPSFFLGGAVRVESS